MLNAKEMEFLLNEMQNPISKETKNDIAESVSNESISYETVFNLLEHNPDELSRICYMIYQDYMDFGLILEGEPDNPDADWKKSRKAYDIMIKLDSHKK